MTTADTQSDAVEQQHPHGKEVEGGRERARERKTEERERERKEEKRGGTDRCSEMS